MVKQATTKTTQKEVLLTFNTLKVENKKLTNKKKCYEMDVFLASRIGLRMAVLALGFASGQYNNS